MLSGSFIAPLYEEIEDDLPRGRISGINMQRIYNLIPRTAELLNIHYRVCRENGSLFDGVLGVFRILTDVVLWFGQCEETTRKSMLRLLDTTLHG